MHEKLPSIGVVIVSFNTCELLRNCLRSLEDCTLPLRIVVVDNASNDASAHMVCRDFPAVELLALEQNLGFAAANNRGIAMLIGTATPYRDTADRVPQYVDILVDYCLFLNPDTVVHPGAIESLVHFLLLHPRVGVVGPRLLNVDGSLQRAAFRFPTLSMSALDVFPPGDVLPGRLYNSWWHGRYPQETAITPTPFAIDQLLGACMLVRSTVLAEVGGFDERYFMYSEEVEWCWRIRKAGWAIWQEPRAQVTHYGGAATSQFRSAMQLSLYRSRVQFFAHHYPRWFLSAHRAITTLGMVRLSLLAWRTYLGGALSRDELRARLFTYSQIARC
jgi:hypothetical protein